MRRPISIALIGTLVLAFSLMAPHARGQVVTYSVPSGYYTTYYPYSAGYGSYGYSPYNGGYTTYYSPSYYGTYYAPYTASYVYPSFGYAGYYYGPRFRGRYWW